MSCLKYWIQPPLTTLFGKRLLKGSFSQTSLVDWKDAWTELTLYCIMLQHRMSHKTVYFYNHQYLVFKSKLELCARKIKCAISDVLK